MKRRDGGPELTSSSDSVDLVPHLAEHDSAIIYEL